MHSAKRQNDFYSSSDSKLEIKANIEGRIQTIEIPQYAIRYPNFDRVCLPVVKQGIHHPNQATAYNCRLDDFNNKFPIENRRSSTNLEATKFLKDNTTLRSQTSVSEAISLIGDVESAARELLEKDKTRCYSAQPELLNRLNNPSKYKLTNCIVGREAMIKMPDDKSETVFRFNRARTVIPDRPLQGHLPTYFDTTPVIDKIGRRNEAATYSNFRESNPNLSKSKVPFSPYGYTSGHYKNYIMYYPRM